MLPKTYSIGDTFLPHISPSNTIHSIQYHICHPLPSFKEHISLWYEAKAACPTKLYLKIKSFLARTAIWKVYKLPIPQKLSLKFLSTHDNANWKETRSGQIGKCSFYWSEPTTLKEINLLPSHLTSFHLLKNCFLNYFRFKSIAQRKSQVSHRQTSHKNLAS